MTHEKKDLQRSHAPVTVGVMIGMLTETHTDAEIISMLKRENLKKIIKVVRK